MLNLNFLILFLVGYSTANPWTKYLNFHPHTRIIGGNETTIEQNPWQVSLQIFGLHNCGGSIIAADTVITAAHCTGLLALLYEVVAGTADLSQQGTRVSVLDCIVHENYDGVDNDIAILKLTQNLTFSDKIQPVALPTEEIAVGETVTVTGWGVLADGDDTTPTILRSVDVQIINNTICAKDYANVDDVRITSRMICAGVNGGGKDSCQGDSGGPLTKNSTLIGVVSWGTGCGDARYPGVYANVFKFVDWIRENAGL